jgi:predicted ABC-type ATPase
MTQGEVREDPSADRPADDSSSDALARQEGSASDESEVREALEQHDEESVDQADRPSDEPNDPNSVTQSEKAPQRAEDIPAHDEPSPLTDKEWSEHLTEVRDTLDKARATGLESHLVYTIDPDHQSWSKDRRTLHDTIINELYSAAQEVPNEGCAVVAGGLGGAGKTTVLGNHDDIDLTKYLMINPDNLKEDMARRGMVPEIDGLSPMEASDLVHEESSYLARQLALRAQHDGKNIIWDITMSTQKSTEMRIGDLREAGYRRIDGLFVDIPIDISIKRTEARHREGHDHYRAGEGLGGRYVPPEVVQRQADSEWDSKNRRTFESIKSKFNAWSIYDNSVDGRRAVLRESSTKRN